MIHEKSEAISAGRSACEKERAVRRLLLSLWVLAAFGLVGMTVGCGRGDDSGRSEGVVHTGKPKPKPKASISIEYEVLPSILLEAESGAIKSPMKVFDDKGCSGGKYVLAPEGPDHKEISIGGDVTYKFSVKEAGQYVLWLRTNFSGACGNSLGIRLDGRDLGKVEDAVFEKWHWVALRAQRPRLTAGTHVLVITNREDGAACDQVLFTQDAEYRPTGIEQPNVKGRIAMPVLPQ